MVRPLDAARADYARLPLNVILGVPSHIAILRALRITATGVSGREVARSAAIAQRAAMEGLARLEDAGLVRRHAVGRTYAFQLNRSHVLVKNAILPLLESEVRFRESLRRAIATRVPPGVVSLALYGSVARREDTPRSDLDLLVLVRSARDRETVQLWLDGLFRRLSEEFGMRLSALVLGLREFASGYRRGESFHRSVVRDAERLVGTRLEEVAGGAKK